MNNCCYISHREKDRSLNNFIYKNLKCYSSCEFFRDNSEWAKEERFTSMNVFFKKFEDNEEEFPILGFYIIQSKFPGRGHFKDLIENIKFSYPELSLMVSNVCRGYDQWEGKFRSFLDKIGFEAFNPYEVEEDETLDFIYKSKYRKKIKIVDII